MNRESERILKKTAFLTVEDSMQLAAGIFNCFRAVSIAGLPLYGFNRVFKNKHQAVSQGGY